MNDEDNASRERLVSMGKRYASVPDMVRDISSDDPEFVAEFERTLEAKMEPGMPRLLDLGDGVLIDPTHIRAVVHRPLDPHYKEHVKLVDVVFDDGNSTYLPIEPGERLIAWLQKEAVKADQA
ncbi:MAG: hypothetical protein AB7G11_11195 [Phycisphaerales bacterium]